uniref:Tyrosine-protein kinase ephrin type A/B receptor-like domain-containing protein n=2 Tax=Ostreococcus mediterraneus TaxID=1486918 RepID=A0A7S2QY24_9CHLO|mmetsp:Transcript_2392/g.3308  ORF Transcript_2392/g.3308 Transcript_2392/m.3308 type:complete len:369 (+) Transcript_2392:180-1286(+)
MKGSRKVVLWISVGVAIIIALALGLGLGLGLKDDSAAAEVVPTFVLASDVKLDGMTKAAFTSDPQLAFRTGMASTLGVAVDDITITAYTDETARRRRSLLAAGLKVEFQASIQAEADETTTDVQNKVAAVTQKITETTPATVAANLQTAFDAVAPASGVTIAVTTQPSTPTVKSTVVVNGVTTTKSVCGTNQYVSNGACTNCATGYTNKAGDDPSGADTSCDAGVPPPPPSPPPPSPPPAGKTYCARNQYVESKTCKPCAAGTYRRAGDDADGADTECSAIVCLANFYVESKACKSCAPGSTRNAGDKANGDDTTCTAILCKEDHYVSKNACVACADGEVNAAGDNASGEDTECEIEGAPIGAPVSAP